MDVETITKLLDAGYTKADIDKLTSGENGTGESETGGVGSDEKQPEETKPEEKKEISTGVEIGAAIEALTNTVAGLKETVKAMQDKAATAASTNTPKGDQTMEVMQSFIDTL